MTLFDRLDARHKDKVRGEEVELVLTDLHRHEPVIANGNHDADAFAVPILDHIAFAKAHDHQGRRTPLARQRTRKAALRRAFVARVVRRTIAAVLAELEAELAKAEIAVPAGCGRRSGEQPTQQDSSGSVQRSSARGRFDAASRGRFGGGTPVMFEREDGRR